MKIVKNTKEVVIAANSVLNLPGFQSTAAISFKQEKNEDYIGKIQGGPRIYIRRPFSDFTLNISDCDRKIALSFDFEDEGNLENSLFKVNTIIEVCNLLKDNMVKSQEVFHTIKKEFKPYSEYSSKEEIEKKVSELEKKLGFELFLRFIND